MFYVSLMILQVPELTLRFMADEKSARNLALLISVSWDNNNLGKDGEPVVCNLLQLLQTCLIKNVAYAEDEYFRVEVKRIFEKRNPQNRV